MAHKGITFIVNLLLWIPVLLTVVPLYLIFLLYKTVLEVIVTKLLKRHNFRPPNNMMDFTMCLDTSYALPNTNCAQVWVVQGAWISASEFSTHFHKCFLEGHPEKYKNLFAHVTTLGSYSFYAHSKQLDLSWHIREYNLTDYGEGTLESWAVTWITTNTYEEGRPVWQVAILHLGSLESGTMETGIVAKFSHALVDGYSFVHMVGKLADNPAPYMVQERCFTWKDKLKYIYNSPRDLLACYVAQAFASNSQSLFKKAMRHSATSSKKKGPQQWFMSFVSLDLNSVKLLRKTTGSHFISLFMSAKFGALRRLLLETRGVEELPEYMWIASSLPWPNHPMTLTNHWTMGYFKCPMRTENPLERLRSLEQYYQDFKANEYDIKGTFSLAPLLRVMPTFWRRCFFHYDWAVQNVNLFFASLLLSERKHYLLGRQVKKIYLPLTLVDVMPAALFGVTTSHSGQIDLAISASNVVARSQEELDRLTRVYFIEELDAIASLCGLQCTSKAEE